MLDIAALSAGKLYAAEYRHLAAAATNPTPRASVPDDTVTTSSSSASQYVFCSSSNSNSGSAVQHSGQALQQTAHAVVIEVPLTQTPSPPASPSAAAASPRAATTAGADNSASSAAGLSLAAAAAAGVPAGLAGKSPEELQQMCAGILVPVQISIARDTWIMWKKGALAVAPVSRGRGREWAGDGMKQMLCAAVCIGLERTLIALSPAAQTLLLQQPQCPAK